MFARIFSVAWVVTATVGLAACGNDTIKRACMQMGTPSALVSGAALFRLDVYSASVACAGATVGSGAGTPQMSHSFSVGQPVTLQVPPGSYTLELTTFADSAGTMALGQGCTAADLRAGANICFDLMLSPAPPSSPVYDGGCSEITSVTNCGACGVVCSIAADNTARLCADGACMYTCAAGHFDCNHDVDHDSDGCECAAGSGCCPASDGGSAGGCQTQHADGVGDNYYDCAPLKTYDQTEAMAACTAFATAHGGSVNDCEATGCGSGDDIVCSDNRAGSGIPCYCWGYAGASKGNVDNQDPDPRNCGCPDGSNWPTWQ